jgi:hypothetical protein
MTRLAVLLHQERGLSLHSWGLTGAADMQRRWLRPAGHWTVVTPTPTFCTVG